MGIAIESNIRSWATGWTQKIFASKRLEYSQIKNNRLSEAPAIHVCAAARIFTPLDIGTLVEWPLVSAIAELWIKGIETVQASCHGESKHEYASIAFNLNTLSSENKRILKNNPHFEVVEVEKDEGEFALHFRIDWKANPTVAQIEKVVLDGIAQFENQKASYITGAPLSWIFDSKDIQAISSEADPGQRSNLICNLLIKRKLEAGICYVYYDGRIYDNLMFLQIRENWKTLEEVLARFDTGEILTVADKLQTLDPEMVLEFTET